MVDEVAMLPRHACGTNAQTAAHYTGSSTRVVGVMLLILLCGLDVSVVCGFRVCFMVVAHSGQSTADAAVLMRPKQAETDPSNHL